MERITTAPTITPRINPQTKICDGKMTVADLANGKHLSRKRPLRGEDIRKTYAILCAIWPQESLEGLLYAQMAVAKSYNLPWVEFGEAFLLKRVNERYECDKINPSIPFSNFAKDFMKPLTEYERTIMKLFYGFDTGIPYTAKEISDYFLFDGKPLSEDEIDKIITTAEKTMRAYADSTFLKYVGYCDWTMLLRIRAFYADSSRQKEMLTAAQQESAKKDQEIAELKRQLADARKEPAKEAPEITKLKQQLAAAQVAIKRLSNELADEKRESMRKDQKISDQYYDMRSEARKVENLEQQLESKTEECNRTKAQLIEARRKLELVPKYGLYAVAVNDEILNSCRMKSERDTLDELNLSTRAYNALTRAGYKTVYDVKCLIRANTLKDVRNCGERTVREIMAKIDSYCSNILSSCRTKSEQDTLDELNLSTRAYNALTRAGYKTVSDVKCLIRANTLKDVRNCGKLTVHEIMAKIDSYCSN